MWIMSSFGILMPAIRPPKTVAKGDDRTMQIRARRAQDLDVLRAQYMRGKLGPVICTPKMDYEFRAYCTPESFAFAVAQMVNDIDYQKFKPTTLDRYEDDELHACYNALWGVVLNHLSSKPTYATSWAGNSGKGAGKAGSGGGGASRYKSYPVGTGFPDEHKTKATTYELPAADDDYSHRPTRASEVARWLDTYTDPEHERDPVLDEVGAALGDPDLHQEISRVDSLYAEMDAILDARDLHTDHSGCDHPASNNARSRCLRRQRRIESERIAELRREIDAITHRPPAEAEVK